MSLSPAFLDELRLRTSLSSLIGRSVKLQKAGREFKACCPFHNEKTPSFTVNDEKGFYHCFGCGAHGDAIRFLTDARGLPFTDNLGNGRIYGLEANASWQVTPTLSLDAAAFINESALSHPDPAFASAQDRDLPNIPGAGARAAAHVRTALSPSLSLAIDAALRYVGRSHLGIGAPVDLVQGGFLDGQIGGRLDFGRFGLSLDVDNVADTRGNSFLFGNPFSVADGLQTTPLRPKTVRLGFDASF